MTQNPIRVKFMQNSMSGVQFGVQYSVQFSVECSDRYYSQEAWIKLFLGNQSTGYSLLDRTKMVLVPPL